MPEGRCFTGIVAHQRASFPFIRTAMSKDGNPLRALGLEGVSVCSCYLSYRTYPSKLDRLNSHKLG